MRNLQRTAFLTERVCNGTGPVTANAMNSIALPKSSLLNKTWEYKRVYRQGKRLQGKNFTLIFTPNDQAGNRFGISIHGRIKGSVKRNRIKRIIKEFYRLNRKFMPPPLDIVFTVRKGFDLQSPAEVGQAVSCLLEKTESFNGQPESGTEPQC